MRYSLYSALALLLYPQFSFTQGTVPKCAPSGSNVVLIDTVSGYYIDQGENNNQFQLTSVYDDAGIFSVQECTHSTYGVQLVQTVSHCLWVHQTHIVLHECSLHATEWRHRRHVPRGVCNRLRYW